MADVLYVCEVLLFKHKEAAYELAMLNYLILSPNRVGGGHSYCNS